MWVIAIVTILEIKTKKNFKREFIHLKLTVQNHYM